jgi:hypothetical protein
MRKLLFWAAISLYYQSLNQDTKFTWCAIGVHQSTLNRPSLKPHHHCQHTFHRNPFSKNSSLQKNNQSIDQSINQSKKDQKKSVHVRISHQKMTCKAQSKKHSVGSSFTDCKINCGYSVPSFLGSNPGISVDVYRAAHGCMRSFSKVHKQACMRVHYLCTKVCITYVQKSCICIHASAGNSPR